MEEPIATPTLIAAGTVGLNSTPAGDGLAISTLQLSVPANTGGYESWRSPPPQNPCAEGDATRPSTLRFKVGANLANSGTTPLAWQAAFVDRNGGALVVCASTRRAIDPQSTLAVEFITYIDTQTVAALAVTANGKSERVCFNGQFVTKCG